MPHTLFEVPEYLNAYNYMTPQPYNLRKHILRKYTYTSIKVQQFGKKSQIFLISLNLCNMVIITITHAQSNRLLLSKLICGHEHAQVSDALVLKFRYFNGKKWSHKNAKKDRDEIM